MPHVSGMMLLDELRRSGYKNPFIFVTAYPSQEASIQALRLGAFDFLEKPFDGAQVRSLLKEAVKVSKSDDQFDRIVQQSMESNPAHQAIEQKIDAAAIRTEEDSKRLAKSSIMSLRPCVKVLPTAYWYQKCKNGKLDIL